MTDTIHSDTRVGAVALTVPDLERSLRFYTETIGLIPLSKDDDQAVLGVTGSGEPLLHLFAAPGATRARGKPGLYHMAIRVPNRIDLARVLYRLARAEASIQGVADHGVSEAVYLADPDHNGIEIYHDRPEDDWPVDDEGRIEMFTDPLDLESLLGELSGQQQSEPSLPPGTVVGHVHLQVSDLAATEQFYTQALGLGLVQRYGEAAIFLAAGDYHHHVGANTWASAGAEPPPPGSAGLRWFELRLPTAAALEQTLTRLRAAGVEVQDLDGGWLVRDPAQIGIVLTA